MARLTDLAPREAPQPPGTRVVVDVRPLQEPERTPVTAAYLQRLLAAFAARPLPGESFVPVLRALRDDPTDDLEREGLPIAGRRRVPPTARTLGSGGLTVDSFLLRGAEVGATVGAADSGARGAVYHTAGGAVPLASRLPVVATLLDLAPWELPSVYARSAAARFGHRLRARILRDATRLIVCSAATAESARRRIHIDPARIAVVPLAADDVFAPAARERSDGLRQRFGLPERYLAYAGLHDARKDFGTLLATLQGLSEEAPPGGEPPWPPTFVLAGAVASTESDEGLRRALERHGLTATVRLLPALAAADLAALHAGARAFVFPAVSEGTGQAALEALACGVPVVASRSGPLPEIVGGAGIVVEPRDPARLASAIRSVWSDDRLHARLAATAARGARPGRRTWHDVARDTRAVYAAAAEAALGTRAGW
jgi:glycosyltransferase involved in cell wall biosynthesis